jgi:hypothetical protein
MTSAAVDWNPKPVVNHVIVPTKIAVYVRSVRLNFVLGIVRCDESRLPAA